MKHYFRCYLGYVKSNILIWGEYKLDFLLINLASVLVLIIGFINIQIIYSQSDTILGWNKYQVFWMLGIFYIIRSIYNTFFINTLNIGYWVRNGMLDIYIIRPLNTFFQLICTGRYNAELPIDEFVMGVGLMIYSRGALNIKLGPIEILYLIVSIIIGELVYASIIFLVSSVSLWTIKSKALYQFISNIEKLLEYPLDIYGIFIKTFLTIIVPLGFVSFYPSQFFFNAEKFKNYIIAGPFVAILLLCIGILVWKSGLKSYQSPGA